MLSFNKEDFMKFNEDKSIVEIAGGAVTIDYNKLTSLSHGSRLMLHFLRETLNSYIDQAEICYDQANLNKMDTLNFYSLGDLVELKMEDPCFIVTAQIEGILIENPQQEGDPPVVVTYLLKAPHVEDSNFLKGICSGKYNYKRLAVRPEDIKPATISSGIGIMYNHNGFKGKGRPMTFVLPPEKLKILD